MKPISLLIFDLDGTLVNTLEDIAASVNYTLSRLGSPVLPLDRVRQYVGDGIEMLMARSLGERNGRLADAVTLYKEHHRQNLVVRSRLYPSVRETLEHFKSLPLSMISNKSAEFIGPLLDGLGIGHYFKIIIGADAGLQLKPAPDAVLRILSELGVSKERAVMVGDGTADIKAGRAAGVLTCAVTYGFRSEDELRTAGPDHVIHELSELKNLFKPENC
jgi:phosphoglycolate phosphatase